MTEYDAGTAALQIFPSFAGVAKAIDKEAQKWGISSGKAYADSFNDTVKKQTGKTPIGPDKPSSTKAGTDSGGSFADGFKKRLEAALKSLPDVKIGAATTEAEQKIKDLSVQLKSLSNQRVGIDISDAEALAELDRIRTELQQVSDETGSIQVRADTTAALAQLDRIRVEADRIAAESPTINVDVDAAAADADLAATKAAADELGASSPNIRPEVDTGPALAGIGVIQTALLGLGAASIIAPLVAGIASIGGPLIAAGAGFAGMAAVAVPAVSDIKKALDAQSKSTANVQKAQQALSTSNGQVASAQQSLADAQRSADQQAISSAEAVKNARQGLADAQQQAAQQNAQAVAQEKTAEQSLTQAQQSAKTAQEALTQARKDAADQLKQLAFQNSDAALNQRQDQLNIESAKQQLQATNKNTGATKLQRQEAQLAYDQAVQALKEQQYQTKQLAAQKATADKKGIDGSDQVVQAQQSIASANQNVSAQQQALVQAQKNVTQTQIQGAENVQKAQQGITDALRNQSNQAANSAAAIQRASSTLSTALAAQHTAQTGVATATGASAAAMDKLSPSEQKAASAFTRLKKAFSGWSKALQPEVLPAFSGGLDLVGGSLNLFSPAIGGASKAIGGLEKSAGKALTGPFWKNFSTFTGKESRTAVTDLGLALGHVVTGLAGVFEFLAPLGNIVLGNLDKITGKFSTFGQDLAKSKPSAATTNAFNQIGKAFGQLASALGHGLIQAFKALLPIAAPMISFIADLITGFAGVLRFAQPLFNFLGKHQTLFKALAGGVLALVVAFKLLSVAMKLGSLLTSLGPWTLVAVAIALVVVGIVELVKHWNAVVHAFATGWHAIVDFFTKDIPNAIKSAINWVADHWKFAIFVSPIAVAVVEIIKHWSTIIDWFKALPGKIGRSLKSLGSAIASPFVAAYSWSKSKITGGIGAMVGWFENLPGRISRGLHTLGSDIAAPFTAAYHWSKDHITSGIDTIVTWFAHLPGRIAKGIAGIASKIASPFESAFSWIIEHVVKPFVSFLNKVLPGNPFPTPSDPFKSSPKKPSSSGPNHDSGKEFAHGGTVPGYAPGRDIVRAMLSPGEGVLVPEAVRGIGGPAAIHAINRRYSSRQPNSGGMGFAGGGIVGDIGKGLSSALHFADHVPGGFFDKMAKAVTNEIGKIAKSLAGSTAQNVLHINLHPSHAGQNATQNRAYAMSLLPHFGWNSAAERNAFDNLEYSEAGYNQYAQNPTSTAYGQGQFLDSTWGPYGPKTSDPNKQLFYMDEYIRDRYGDPITAWAYHLAHNSYDQGGDLPPGITLAYNGTGKTEHVFTDNQLRAIGEGRSGSGASADQIGKSVARYMSGAEMELSKNGSRTIVKIVADSAARNARFATT